MGFSNPILAGSELVREAIRSAGYVPGVAGWRIARDGSAEFNNVIVRGTIQSSNYVAGVAGWRLLDSGAAELSEATIRGNSQLAGATITGDLTMSGSGRIRTAASGQRVELTTGGVTFYDSDGTNRGSLLGSTATPSGLVISGATSGGVSITTPVGVSVKIGHFDFPRDLMVSGDLRMGPNLFGNPTIYAYGDLEVGGKGKLGIGFHGSNYFAIAEINNFDVANKYGLLCHSTDTYLNAPGGLLYFRQNNATRLAIGTQSDFTGFLTVTASRPLTLTSSGNDQMVMLKSGNSVAHRFVDSSAVGFEFWESGSRLYLKNSSGWTDMRVPWMPELAGGQNVWQVTSSWQIGRQPSTIESKRNLRPFRHAGADNPVFRWQAKSFEWNPDRVQNADEENERLPAGTVGLIAEEVRGDAPEAVPIGPDGEPAGLDALILIAYLVDAVQFLRGQIERKAE